VRALFLVAVVGCAGSSDSRPAPAPPVPIATTTRACADAAAGLERATRGIRAPEQSVLRPARHRCTADDWPVLAIECFADMTADDLGTCAAKLPKEPREALIAILGGNQPDRASVAILLARLSTLRVGVAACDRFVAAVTIVMSCEQLPLDSRVALGNETVDFWSLPTSGLPIEARARIEAACGESLQSLEQHAVDVGCMP
jgi:hypothetical protein